MSIIGFLGYGVKKPVPTNFVVSWKTGTINTDFVISWRTGMIPTDFVISWRSRMIPTDFVLSYRAVILLPHLSWVLVYIDFW